MTEKWKVESGKWKVESFFLSSPFSIILIKSNTEHSTKLNLTPKTLISLIIKLINPVDKAVDKLWISCG